MPLQHECGPKCCTGPSFPPYAPETPSLIGYCVCCVCRTDKSADGYTLGAFSWYLDQTIGGAISTATHGSSLVYGSLSSQVR